MIKLIAFFGFLFIILQYEYIRFKQIHHQCLEQQATDHDLLSRDICQDMEDRYRFRNKVDCEGAEQRLKVTLFHCAFEKWWKTSSLVDMFNTLTGSYWSLMGMILPVIVALLYFRNKYQTEMAMADRIERISDKLTKKPKMIKEDEKQLKIKSTDNALAYR